MTNDFKALEQRLEYVFSDPGLLRQALTHRSADALNNERLEFLGDSILNLTIAAALYDLSPGATEGELTRIRSSLVKRDALVAIAKDLDISAHIKLGQGERRSGGQRRESIQADAVEAILGAVLLDGGIVVCQQLIRRLYSSRLTNLPDAEKLKDPKTRLQEYLQARSMGLPEYHIARESGKDHEKYFEVNCRITDDQIISGLGSSRRKAEQDAANKALDLLINEQ